MKNIWHYLLVSFLLIFLSFIMFLFHYLVFGQLENTIYYSLMSLCFIPINILAVTIVFEKIAERRARLERLSKLNMLVGLFFSDIGFNLLKFIVDGDPKIHSLNLNFSDIKDSYNKLSKHDHILDFKRINYPELKKLVLRSRDILINLISNESVLEHETFTDLLMALMHLRDEIIFMENKDELNKDDCTHISFDITRVYKALTIQWLDYLEHLKQFYPYQYTSSIKYNPFKLPKL